MARPYKETEVNENTNACTRSIWTPGHVTGRALKTLRQKNELITGRALDDASFLLNECTCASVLETALSFSFVPLCSLGGWELPSKQSQVATIITSSLFFSFKRGDALFAILVDCLSNLSFCCKWVNQRVKNSSLSLSPLYVYISVLRGAMGGAISGLNGSGQRLIHNNHQWLWERTGHRHTRICATMQKTFQCIPNIHTSVSSESAYLSSTHQSHFLTFCHFCTHRISISLPLECINRCNTCNESHTNKSSTTDLTNNSKNIPKL